MEKRCFRLGIKIQTKMNNKIDQVPEEFKQLAEDFSKNGFITTSLDNLINWSRSGSLHWMTFGLACCAVEMMQTAMPRYDLERFGAAPRGSPRPVSYTHLTLPTNDLV